MSYFLHQSCHCHWQNFDTSMTDFPSWKMCASETFDFLLQGKCLEICPIFFKQMQNVAFDYQAGNSIEYSFDFLIMYVESLEISAASWISYTRTHPREHLLRKWQTVFFPPYIAIRTFNEKILWLKLTLQFFFPYNCTIILSDSICMYSKNAFLCL